MSKLLMDIIQVSANIAIVLTFIITIYIFRENISSRKTSIRPLLMPGRVNQFFNDDNLFAGNYEYPLTDDVGTTALVHFGIKNAGKGVAKNVNVLNFRSEEEEPIEFRVGNNSISIPEGEHVPFVIRIARKDPTEYFFITYSTTISYEDIFGKKFYISIRLWVQESGVIVIEYNDAQIPQWKEFMTVVSREVELNGFFEMRQLEERINDNKRE
ncbi:hypothetical protein KQ941_11425 [Paenibacillus xylanexedens]|uniref:hypothetical protein n=1 Tax=Paenibacillus xylanexedens TaxID=528191 RepID=UPI001F3185F0|nr:hypothetical protein [Paenibacillus xylanexedens]MCF7755054.1 hypothetical protein [Paenibacillus xylanexedens]